MAEFWSVMESNPIKVINPTQSWRGKKLDPRLDPLNVKSHQKNHLPSLRWEMVKLQGFKVGADTFPVGTRDETRRDVAGSVENKDYLSP